MGFLTALVLILIGIWTRFRNCLTIGVILAIVCFGVAIHNCLRRGDAAPTISVNVRRDSQLSLSCDDLEIAEPEENIAEAHTDAEVASRCGSRKKNVSPPNQDENENVIGASDPILKCSHVPVDVEAARIQSLGPRIHRDSAFQSLTRAIITTLMRTGRSGGSGGGSGCGSSFHQAPRNAWNSNFESHIGWQSALARPDPFYSTSFYR